MRLLIFLKNGGMMAHNKHVQNPEAAEHLRQFLRLEGFMVMTGQNSQGYVPPHAIEDVVAARVIFG